MKSSSLAWIAVLALLCEQQAGAIEAIKKLEPTFLFDAKGRLILVLTPDGKRCTYRYAADGRLVSPIVASCGEPRVWLQDKPGG